MCKLNQNLIRLYGLFCNLLLSYCVYCTDDIHTYVPKVSYLMSFLYYIQKYIASMFEDNRDYSGTRYC